MNLIRVLGILVVIVIISFSIGLLFGRLLKDKQDCIEDCAYKTSDSNQYPFLARRIFLENANDTILSFTNLRNYLRKFSENSPSLIGIYFEYLPTGTTIGINDREVFYAASLIKAPTLMFLMKNIEEGKISYDEMLTVESHHIDSGFGELWKKGTGTKISVKDAFKYALLDSDNTAYRLLLDRVDSLGDITEVYDYLDIPRDIAGPGGGISPKNFSSILRSLYFSAYLSYDKSNEFLDTMSGPSKHDIISLPIPSSIKVANKIGFYENETQNDVYSDCGIVYVPRRNYSLCIMVTGADNYETAKQEIQDVSGVIYKYIRDSNRK